MSSEEVCFDDLGCFSNDSPYDSLPAFPPFPPSRINTRFILYTRLNKDLWMEVFRDDPESLATSLFQPELKTVVFIHGYANPGFRGELCTRMKDALLEKVSIHIILLIILQSTTCIYCKVTNKNPCSTGPTTDISSQFIFINFMTHFAGKL